MDINYEHLTQELFRILRGRLRKAHSAAAWAFKQM